MKKLLFFGALVVLAVCAQAQIAVQVKTNHPAYIQYEPIMVRVTLTNMSGNTLVFNGEGERENGSLSFDVQCINRSYVKQTDLKANPLSDLILPPGASSTLELRLDSIFDLRYHDRYTLTAVVKHNRMANAYQSKPVCFDVADGFLIEGGERQIGLPSANSQDMIEKMYLRLVRFKSGTQSLFCLRCEDDSRIYATFRLGPYLISGQKPQMEIENGNLVHILVHITPRVFYYTTFSIRNHTVKRRLEKYYLPMKGVVPTLVRSGNTFRVINATEARQGIDYHLTGDTNWKE